MTLKGRLLGFFPSPCPPAPAPSQSSDLGKGVLWALEKGPYSLVPWSWGSANEKGLVPFPAWNPEGEAPRVAVEKAVWEGGLRHSLQNKRAPSVSHKDRKSSPYKAEQ